MATISRGITLSYKKDDGGFVMLEDLQEIPELGGTTDAIEITTLADTAHRFTDGLLNYGDSLPFKFLYTQAQFDALVKLTGKEMEWQVVLSDDYACTFSGICAVKLDGVGVNSVLTYTLSVTPSSVMTWATL